MIKMSCALTLEIDEPEQALSEILDQIDFGSLLKNSVGIISCNYEFISNGIVKYLCDNLPFDVIGLTTIVTLVNGEYDQYSLGLTVITSDDISFKTISTVGLNIHNYEEELDRVSRDGLTKSDKLPSFIITVFPYLLDASGSLLISQFGKSFNGIPVWGTVCSDDTTSFTNARTIFNGEDSTTALPMILMYGPVKPNFFVSALPDRNISSHKAVITNSDDHRVYSVNDITLVEYFEQMGIQLSEGPDVLTIPAIIDYGDGLKPVASAFFKIFPDGSGLTSIKAPQGATISLGEIDYEGIMETAEESILNVLDVENATGVLMFPCITRYMMSSPRSDDEMRLVIEKIGTKLPYMLAYSGGELCPVPDTDGALHNRYHNYTFVACVFS